MVDRGHRELPDPPGLRRQEPADSARRDGRRQRATGVDLGEMREVKHLLSIGRPRRQRRHRRAASAHRLVRRGERAADPARCPRCEASTVVSLFYEDSTRTRLSASRQAAKRLSADTMNFSVSIVVGEQGRVAARHGRDDRGDGRRRIVVRHKSSGVPWQIAGWVDASVVNAGDGWHEHPTQALLDCYTIRASSIGIDGRLHRDRRRHQALAGGAQRTCSRSTLLGARGHARRVRRTLLPPSLEGWPRRRQPRPRRRAAEVRCRLPAAHAARAA